MTQRVPTEQRSPALKAYYANLEANRANMREKAKARYHADKQAKLLKNAEYRRNNPEKLKLIKELSNKKYNKRRFFFVRACSIAVRMEDGSETNQLAAILSRAWYNQRGRCAYTGKRLDRKAQVDHKTPVTRGGDNDSQNLHWVTADVNNAKGSMTHDEFLAVCLCVSSNSTHKTP
jgi:5-methylcytosine-specific restriction endonuclease McrA